MTLTLLLPSIMPQQTNHHWTTDVAPELDIFNNETPGSDTNTDSDDTIIYDTSEPRASP
ncbi:hypothetical protein C8F04DRAFT_1253903 [Mycena alexandri]|uniref:Uncharacterized protein n=1 Tax=Mycena alexandri TaxID=1745969 RepID=A0AAD6X699_9AGAR|nr:hypothetical protein C8F04DRAFT_1253903 [Mycena alexandri]